MGPRSLSGRRSSFLLVCACLTVVLSGSCAAVRALAQSDGFLSHQAWSTEEGLPQASVHQIFQSHDGYLWLATEGGVARFDAAGFKTYTHADYPAFISDDVSSIAEAPAGMLWFGTSDGLIRSDGAHLRRFTASDGLPSASILSLAKAPDGTLLVLTAAGLVRFNGSRFVAPDSISSPVTSLERSPDGTVWLFGNGVPLRYDSRGIVPVPIASPAGEPVIGVQTGPGGALWAWTARTITVRSGALHRVFTAGKDFAGSRVQSLLVDREGSAWIGTNRGLFTVAALPSARVQSVDYLGADSILSIFQDRESDIWVGTEDSGLDALRPRKFRAEPTAAGEGVTTVVQASDGAMCYGTRDEGVRCLRDGRAQSPVPAAALTSPVILSLAPGTHGDLWAGTPDGLNHIEHGSVRKYTSADGLPDDFVRSVVVDRDGSVWLGTRSGLGRLDRGRISSITRADGLASNSIGPLFEATKALPESSTDDHQLAIGTAAGLTLLSGGRPRNFFGQDLSESIVTAITQDQTGELWVGFYNGGLSRFARGRFQRIDAPGLPAEIDGMAVDSTGYLWLRGKRGVYRASLQALDGCAATNLPCKPSIDRYGVADGLPSDELTAEGSPSIWQTEDGDLWFATRKGLGLTEPSHLPLNAVPPPVVVQRFTVDDVEQPLTAAPLRIASGHRSFTFDYAALSYTMPLKTRYRYRLEGFDRDWIDAGARRTAYYTSLPGRRYRFQVIAENNDGVWNKVGAEVRFSVLPPFYLRWWFFVLLLAVIAALAALAVQIRLHGIRRQFALVLNERNRVAREIHDTLAQDLVSVSLQLELVSQLVRANKLPQASEQIQDARALVKRGLAAARQSIWNLRANVAQNSLPARLSKAVEEFARNHPASQVKIGGAYRKLSEHTENEVLRIAQESLSNVDRHAAATEVLVDLRYEAGGLALTVQDNGRGFSCAAVQSMDGHYGVRGMEERADALGGSLTITSNPGEGTTVILNVPLRGSEGS